MKKIILFLCFSALVGSIYGQLIINHNHRDITTLSESEINLAKSRLHIAYGHTSHGSQLIDGMNGLITFANNGGKGLSLPNDIFKWNDGILSGTLDLDDYAMGGDVGSFPDWYDNTRNYLGDVDPETGMGTTNPDVNVIMWSWCGQVSGKYANGILYSDFLEPMALLETTYPNVKFVYMTGHLDHWDDANNKAANDSIRRHCLREEKILYDFADIESYDPDGTFFQYAGDDCSYYSSTGTLLGNWATEWRATHTENVDWYNCGAQHSDALNANQKAYAAWHMFVEIAKIIASEEIPEDLTVNDTIVANGESACFNATNSITVEGASAAVTFENGSSVNLIAGNSITLLPGFYAQAGSYTHAYITTNDSYCFELPSSIVATPPNSIKSTPVSVQSNEESEKIEQAIFKVYPNPSKGSFKVQLTDVDSSVQLMIFNAVGSLVYQTKTNDTILTVNLGNAQHGIYFIKAISENEQFTQKIRIE